MNIAIEMSLISAVTSFVVLLLGQIRDQRYADEYMEALVKGHTQQREEREQKRRTIS
jgi:hypothetical protein